MTEKNLLLKILSEDSSKGGKFYPSTYINPKKRPKSITLVKNSKNYFTFYLVRAKKESFYTTLLKKNKKYLHFSVL